MARISWNDSQKKALARNVRRFNDKITRTEKSNPALAPYLPKKVSVRELRKTIKTAKDLDYFVRSVDRAFKPKAFEPVTNAEGVATTRYQLNELKIATRRINRARKRELDALQLSTAKGTMGTVNANNLKPKKFDFENIKASDWEKFVAATEKQAWDSYTDSKWELYKENYLKALIDQLGDYGVDIYDLVFNMPSSAVAAGMDNVYLTITFLYSKYDQQAKAEIILYHWQQHYDNWKATKGKVGRDFIPSGESNE